MHDFIYTKIHFYDNKPFIRPGRGQAHLNWWLMLILFFFLRWYMLLQKNINKTLLYVRKGKLTSNILFQHPRMTKSWSWTWVHRDPNAFKSKNIGLLIMGLRAASDQDIANQDLYFSVCPLLLLLNGHLWFYYYFLLEVISN